MTRIAILLGLLLHGVLGSLALGYLAPGYLVPGPAAAQTDTKQQRLSRSQKSDISAWTVGLAGGLIEGSFIRYASDLAKVLDDGDNLRVIPMVTFGAVGNVNDLLNLRGVDVAITQADMLDYFQRELKVPNITARIQYISPLYLAEVHVYARAEIKTLADLAGRKVAFNTAGSAANLTGQVVFRRLGIAVEPLLINNALALERMRSGEIAALVHVVGKPNELFTSLRAEPGFHFLPIEYGQAFEDVYLPSILSAEDYPQLIAPNQTVPTLAVVTVLAVYNWPKNSEGFRRVSRFVDAYFAKFQQLRNPPFQPKWKDINLAATVPGWTRFSVAEEALARMRAARPQGGEPR
jgi:TRAP-type uncharacterized transport system substrate-binding protein